MPHKFKVLVVGLDGATFDLMLPWIEEGYLPHLGGLLREGAHSELRSTIPPITPCAWSSLITGKNPGKHGLFDFVEPADGPGRWRFTNASSRDGESLWSCLSRHGQRVGVVNVPMTFPPERVNGFLISGLDTPHEGSDYMFPREVRRELKDASIRYRIDQQHLGNMTSSARRQQQLDSIFVAERSRTKAFSYLSKRRPADFRMIVYGATDQVQHHFWQYMDTQHDKYDPIGAKKFQHAIRDTYQLVDQQLGELLDGVDDDTVVMIMSDHGFGPTSNVRIRLNSALKEAGFLSYQRPKEVGYRQLVSWLDRWLRSTLSSDMKRAIAGRFPRLRTWFESLEGASIDWEQSMAYCNETYRSSPAIWLQGDDLQVLRQVEACLMALCDPQTGERAIGRCVRPRALYDGPHAKKAPHLLPSWWEDGFLIERSQPAGSGDAVQRCQEPIRGGVEFAGSHRMQGVFMAAGGPVKKGFGFAGAEIIDVAPTVMYLMGVPIPRDLDGEVLVDCLDEEFVANHPIRFEAGQDEGNATENVQRPFTQDEQELISQRLQALGYVE